MVVLVRSERSGSIGAPKQKIALFFHSSTMKVDPCRHLNFRAKAAVMYSIKSDDFFEKLLCFGTKKLDTLKSASPTIFLLQAFPFFNNITDCGRLTCCNSVIYLKS